MEIYKIFKKSENYIKTLSPLITNPTCKVGVIFGATQLPTCGYDEDENFYLILDNCPQIKVGSCLRMKNMRTNLYENVGLISQMFYVDGYGYVVVFEESFDEELAIVDVDETIDD
jgi:hypothetical protein